jgi:predicted porin
MNQKILTFAVAAAIGMPMAVHADVTVSGKIQAEASSLEVADGNQNVGIIFPRGDGANAPMADERHTLTVDGGGAILNEGPNYLQFDFEEEMGNDVSAEARYVATFNTSGNYGSSLTGLEAWIGLRTSNFHFRYGSIGSAYVSSKTLIDPWAFTSLQSGGTGGGMSGEHFNVLYGTRETKSCSSPSDETCRFEYNQTNFIGVNHALNLYGMTNEGVVPGGLELGLDFAGFSATLQGVVDDASGMDGAGLLELKYTAPSFAVWLAGSFSDLDESVKSGVANVGDSIGLEPDKRVGGDFVNWKIGGQFKGPMFSVGLQYEDAELGTLDTIINGVMPTGGDDPEFFLNEKGGKYLLGSFDLKMSDFGIAGWVAGYRSDINDALLMRDDMGNVQEENALSWALGAKYNFSTRSQVYLGYRQTDSENDLRDENVATLGISHSF